MVELSWDEKKLLYRPGICGGCGKKAEVRYVLTERGNVQYFYPGSPIEFCKECEERWGIKSD